ncbi:hypothetical protein EIN_328710 [Entamoeba invadens IP1]|uniref:Rho-GAP domain-containing protein n=1 Tax=Entamoeba invadens IP1 TaxID=370355 RepID=A0A0A1TXT9_ENTIV|nr:hypothetical protein EIN_328710 [Entamoeba invadens IP1]ELP86174.1 hypothetical protein EIN_328710 [Entamoeba invadens IP1]|eukprot:XP_004185520.1 hypothetical protein EIN_328710 [Entamoeba invadens IP1]
MPAKNLAICLSPCLLFCEKTELVDCGYATIAIEEIINGFEFVFDTSNEVFSKEKYKEVFGRKILRASDDNKLSDFLNTPIQSPRSLQSPREKFFEKEENTMLSKSSKKTKKVNTFSKLSQIDFDEEKEKNKNKNRFSKNIHKFVKYREKEKTYRTSKTAEQNEKLKKEILEFHKKCQVQKVDSPRELLKHTESNEEVLIEKPELFDTFEAPSPLKSSPEIGKRPKREKIEKNKFKVVV